MLQYRLPHLRISKQLYCHHTVKEPRTVLVKFRIVATIHAVRHICFNRESSLVPEARVVASLVVVVTEVKVPVVPVRLPLYLMLLQGEWRGGV